MDKVSATNIDNIEFKLFDKDKESYIIGDLLNMPFFFANWNNNPHNNKYMYDLFKKTSKDYSENILGIYDKLRYDEDEPIPNVEKIINSIDIYINNNQDKLVNLLELCKDPNNLFVHLRSGDKGIIEDEFINKIKLLQSKYNKIIILTGIHHNAERSKYFPSVNESIDNTKQTLKKLDLDSSKLIIDLSEPDIHLCVMRNAKNLMVHIGGFSILGALAFNGNNLYLTNVFFPLKEKNTNFFNYVKEFIILED